jgi:hypothetical protein
MYAEIFCVNFQKKKPAGHQGECQEFFLNYTSAKHYDWSTQNLEFTTWGQTESSLDVDSLFPWLSIDVRNIARPNFCEMLHHQGSPWSKSH